MATDTLLEGANGTWDTANIWSDGVPPAPGDTVVLTGLGGSAPVDNSDSGSKHPTLIDDSKAPSDVTLSDQVLVNEGDSVIYDPGLIVISTLDVPAGDELVPGNTISNTVDMLGDGSLASMDAENTTFTAGSVINVNGSAVINSYFSSQFNGTINVGLPFAVDGAATAAPAANVNGYSSELDLEISPDGSWLDNQGTYSLTGYVPSPTNNGTINIGASSAFRFKLAQVPESNDVLQPIIGGPPGTPTLIEYNPTASQFINNGTINVEAGGNASFYDQTPYDLLGLYNGDQVINNGTINVLGAQGATTTFYSEDPIVGGVLNIDGGTATDPSATTAELWTKTTNTLISVNDATLRLDLHVPGYGDTTEPGQYSGSNIELTGSNDVVWVTLSQVDVNNALNLIHAAGAVTDPIYNFKAGDQIQLTYQNYNNFFYLGKGQYTFTSSWDQATHTLEVDATVPPNLVNNGSTSEFMTLTLEGNYDPSSFQLSVVQQPQHGGALVTITTTTTNPDSGAPCFAAGTRIATLTGQVPVETLAAGDHVLLHDGGLGRVRWTGHRRVDCAAHPAHAPIRISAGALGPNIPSRDLLVSPDHALYLDGALVPADLLVNGGSITRADDIARVTYHHVELEQHAILLAEGAPAESYLDTGNRARFANCPLCYDPVVATADPCADMILAGARLEEIRGLLPVFAEA